MLRLDLTLTAFAPSDRWPRADGMRLERRTAGGWPETDIDETLGTMRSVYERLPGDGYYVQVPGMFHLDMTDAHLLSPLVPWPGLAGPIGAERAHHIINAYSVAFFDKELRGRRAPLLDVPSGGFPEVVLEHRRPSARVRTTEQDRP